MSSTEDKVLRAQLSSKERHTALVAANLKARQQFVDKYEGASLRLKTTLHNRPVIREFKRAYNICMRNWHVATSVPSSALGDAGLAVKIEEGMLKKIAETTKYFKLKVAECHAHAKDADVDFSLLSHGVVFTDDTRVIGPVAMQLRQMFLEADRYIDLTQVLYAYSTITGVQAIDVTWDVKRQMQAVSTSLRNFRRLALEKVNTVGGGRDGFRAVVTDGDHAGVAKADLAEATASKPAEAPVDVPGTLQAA